jgi:hypothetical protein
VAHHARRPLNQLVFEPFFKALELKAGCRLRCVEKERILDIA